MTSVNLATISKFLIPICETPAPTFDESARGELVKGYFKDMGLEPTRDAVGNIIVSLAGGEGPSVLVAAHLDTVFDAHTDVTVKKTANRWSAPGIGDNSASLAVMLTYAQEVLTRQVRKPRLTLAATVGEEGLGDLYGMRELLRQQQNFDLMIAIDGHLGSIVHQSVGSKRYELRFGAKGGHSWGDYPNPSAIHALGDTIHALTRIRIPSEPRSSLNIGQVSGGTSINAIAQNAVCNLDIRSIDADVLTQLEEEALTRIRRIVRQHQVTCDIKKVGDRPTGKSNNQSLVQAAKNALASQGLSARLAPSSTDANAATALGIPAIALGVYTGGDAHRLSEWLEPDSLATGYQVLASLMEQLSQPSQGH